MIEKTKHYSTKFSRQFHCVFSLSLALIAVASWAVLSAYSGKPVTATARPPVVINSVPVVCVSAINFEATSIAPDSQVSAFGTLLATITASGMDTDPVTPGVQLPTQLGGTTVEVNGRLAALLFVSPGQINFIMPGATEVGTANITVTSGDGTISQGTLQVRTVAPAVLTINRDGKGAPDASLQRFKIGGAQTFESPYQFNAAIGANITKPIDLSPVSDRVFLILNLSGISHAPNTDGDASNGAAENIRLIVGGEIITPTFAGPQGSPGVDQLNAELPRSLIGAGLVSCAVTGAGFASNSFELEFASAPTFSAPTISSFSPMSALAGGTLAIAGSGFSSQLASNSVRIAGLDASVISVTPNELQVKVPFGVQSGQISVRTPNGEGLSTERLTLRTSISGFVQNTSSEPLANMTARLGTTMGISDGSGNFIIADVPGGAALVEIDGSTIPASPPYPSVVLKQIVSNGRDNQFSSPIYLQQASGPSVGVGTSSSGGGDHENEVEETSSGPHAEGNEFSTEAARNPQAVSTISLGNVTLGIQPSTHALFPNGATVGNLTLSLLNKSLTPVNLPAGVFSNTIIQITPFRVMLNPGAKLTFPNTDGLPVGSKVTLWTLDQDLNSPTVGSFVPAGEAIVSADGQRIETANNAVRITSIFFVSRSSDTTTITTAIITGQVVDCGGQPVAGAVVSARGQNQITDGQGSFVLRAVPLFNPTESVPVEVSLIRNGQTTRLTKNVIAVQGGVASVSFDLSLSSANCRPRAISQVISNPACQKLTFRLQASESSTGPLSLGTGNLRFVINSVSGIGAAQGGTFRLVGAGPYAFYMPPDIQFPPTLTIVFSVVNQFGVRSNLATVIVKSGPCP